MYQITLSLVKRAEWMVGIHKLSKVSEGVGASVQKPEYRLLQLYKLNHRVAAAAVMLT